jgi:hypothetical protein
VELGYNNLLKLQLIQKCGRIRIFKRKRFCRVANNAGQTCFVGITATLQLHFDDGDWPSGKAPGSGPDIGGSNPSSPAMKNDSSSDGSFFMFEEG